MGGWLTAFMATPSPASVSRPSAMMTEERRAGIEFGGNEGGGRDQIFEDVALVRVAKWFSRRSDIE
jgi:hypothetical protein